MTDAYRSAPALSNEDRQWGMFAHFAVLSMFLTGVGCFVGPLIVWLMKRDESAFVEEQGREALNFGITIAVWYVAAILMLFTVILIPVSIAIFSLGGLAAIVLPLMAGFKASKGEPFRYPLTLRFVS